MNLVFELENAREQMGVKDVSCGVSGLLALDTQEWEAVCNPGNAPCVLSDTQAALGSSSQHYGSVAV